MVGLAGLVLCLLILMYGAADMTAEHEQQQREMWIDEDETNEDDQG